MDDAASSFARLLRTYRQAAGLTQEELAERAGLSVRGISALERAPRRRPQRATMQLLAQALELRPHEQAMLLAAARLQPEVTTPAEHARSGRPRRQEIASAGERSPAVGRPPLVGRQHEMALLGRHLVGEGPPVLLLAGEPGIGKSRFLEEAAMHAARAGLHVLAGGCTRSGGQEPFAPLVQAIQDCMGRRPPVERPSDLRNCAWLVRLLPELAAGPIAPLPGWALSPEQERRLMFRAVESYLANVAGPRGVLLLLDDLQWAGADVLDLLGALVRSAQMALRVVGAYRDTEVQPGQVLSSWAADLAHAGLVAQYPLPPLTEEEASRLLDGLLAEQEDTGSGRRERILEQAGGVPFFLLSWTQSLRMHPASGGPEGVPWGVAQSIRERVAALPETARLVLAAAAVLGREISRPVVTRMLELPRGEVADALAVVCRARLLEEDGHMAYRFAHDVIREAIEGDLGTARRAALHHRAAQALAARPGQAAPELIAYHHVRSDTPERAIPYLERAGDRAWAQHANEAAADYFRDLMEHRDRLGERPGAASAREKLAMVLRTLARYDAAQAWLEQAVALYTAAGDTEGVTRVTVQIGRINVDAGTPEDGLERLRPLLTQIEQRGSARNLAALCVTIAQLLGKVGRHSDQLATAGRGVRLARDLSDDRLIAEAETTRSHALYGLGRAKEAREAVQAAVHAAEGTDDLAAQVEALEMATYIAAFGGDVGASTPYVERALAAARRLGNPASVVAMLALRGEVGFWSGRWDEARDYLERSVALSRSLRLGLEPVQWLGELCMAEGNWEDGSRYLEEGIAVAKREGALSALLPGHLKLAERDILQGRPAAARDRLLPLLQYTGHGGMRVPRVLAWAYLELGAMDAAEVMLYRALECARSMDSFAVGDALWVQALIAVRQGRWEEAERALEEGLALRRRMPHPYEEARLLHVYGQLHARKGETEAARTRLDEALAIFRRLGACKDIEGAEQLLSTLG